MVENKNIASKDASARKQAQHDIVNDPDLKIEPESDNLDEGELARKDNSSEKAFDELEQRNVRSQDKS